MVRVMRTGTTRYKGATYKPYQEFVIDDKDKDMMVKLGCTILEDKVANPRKVEPEAEVPEETKVDTTTKKDKK